MESAFGTGVKDGAAELKADRNLSVSQAVEVLCGSDIEIEAAWNREIDQRCINPCVDEAVSLLGRAGRIHISLDIDAVDPLEAPGVGTPWPGGLTYREAHLAMELLADTGKPLIHHTWEAARRARSLAEVIVATDSSEIASVVRGFGGRCEMTGEHPSGTDRIAEVAAIVHRYATATTYHPAGGLSSDCIHETMFER